MMQRGISRQWRSGDGILSEWTSLSEYATVERALRGRQNICLGESAESAVKLAASGMDASQSSVWCNM